MRGILMRWLLFVLGIVVTWFAAAALFLVPGYMNPNRIWLCVALFAGAISLNLGSAALFARRAAAARSQVRWPLLQTPPIWFMVIAAAVMLCVAFTSQWKAGPL
jgi:uncharacterized membrane protein YhaH (DUF805 family)